MQNLTELLTYTLSFEITRTILFILALFLIRSFLIRFVKGLKFKNIDSKRKWVSTSRTITFIFIIVILTIVWGEEIRSAALSLAAVAVALVLAFKELILSFTAGLIRASSKLFDVGDRVTILGKRGEVVEYNLLSTTLLEIGPGESSNQYTGRLIKIPNTQFIEENIILTPKGDHYTLKILELPVTLDKNIFKKQELLLKSAEAISAPYYNLAEEYINKSCKKLGVETPNLKPRVLYEMKTPKVAEFHVRMPMPFNSLTRTENKIKDMFLSKCFSEGIEI